MSPGSKLRWLWRAPARALGRARDMYVRSVTNCSRYVPSDAAFGYPMIAPAALARSHSYGSDWSGAGEEDLRELIRAASKRAAEQRQAQEAQAAAIRSRSVAGLSAMARIDEDAPCEFVAGGGEDAAVLYPRSQSCVAGRRSAQHCQRKVAALV